jgi:hypothetical protein
MSGKQFSEYFGEELTVNEFIYRLGVSVPEVETVLDALHQLSDRNRTAETHSTLSVQPKRGQQQHSQRNRKQISSGRLGLHIGRR